MNFIIDIGNTQLKAALFEGVDLIEHFNVSYNDLGKIIRILTEYPLDRIALSHVRAIPDELKHALKGKENMVYSWDESFRIPLVIDYKTPETLGHDRICNAVAAHSFYPLKNALIIDLGTCNKYDFVNEKGVYLGGAISPGFEMRYLAMHHFTNQLPLLDASACDNFQGDSTKNSMHSGAYYGIIGEINYYIEQYKSRFNDIEVILTGGFSTYFDKEVKNHIFADPYLTLKGLNIILNFQEEK